MKRHYHQHHHYHQHQQHQQQHEQRSIVPTGGSSPHPKKYGFLGFLMASSLFFSAAFTGIHVKLLLRYYDDVIPPRTHILTGVLTSGGSSSSGDDSHPQEPIIETVPQSSRGRSDTDALLPPIYWINMDASEDRRNGMQDMFLALGEAVDAKRVAAMDIPQTLELWNTGRLVFHPDIRLEDRDGRRSMSKHVNNIYEYGEAACLLSHLKAIRQAYLDGHTMALILEDDALVSQDFLRHWRSYVDRAPMGWKILQFAANNANILKQFVNLLDPFVSWQRYHYSTRAYLINRAGMETILNKTYAIDAAKGEDQWRVDEYPMVVADEAIYYLAGDTYTSTGLWIDALNFGSTIQANNAHKDLSSILKKTPDVDALLSKHQHRLPQSILVLMNVRARNEQELARELQWIRQDNYALCSHHETCIWEINLVLTDPLLEPIWQQASHQQLPENVHVHTQVHSDAFNKFAFVRSYLDRMMNYDLVLFKDNDQRISGLPWRTFLKQKGNATLAGPLRQNVDDAMLYRRKLKLRQWFQFHSANAWRNGRCSANLFASVTPTEVPVLEMYFVVFDAKFAHNFFQAVLTPEYLSQTSAWGPDFMWCSAAKEWDPTRPGCLLVPVSSTHEDTRQISKDNTDHKENGAKMVSQFEKDPKFRKWMRIGKRWSALIRGKLSDFEHECRKLLRLNKRERFYLSDCSKRVMEMA